MKFKTLLAILTQFYIFTNLKHFEPYIHKIRTINDITFLRNILPKLLLDDKDQFSI
jgi:hypothetical protein